MTAQALRHVWAEGDLQVGLPWLRLQLRRSNSLIEFHFGKHRSASSSAGDGGPLPLAVAGDCQKRKTQPRLCSTVYCNQRYIVKVSGIEHFDVPCFFLAYLSVRSMVQAAILVQRTVPSAKQPDSCD